MRVHYFITCHLL